LATGNRLLSKQRDGIVAIRAKLSAGAAGWRKATALKRDVE
jgi:hypothetical protein